MKKMYLLVVMLFTTILGFGQSSDLYFSMYGEGSSSNKFIEIFNGTNADIDLTPYVVNLYSNGGNTVKNTIDLTGTLKQGDVFVIVNSSADDAIKANADVESSVTYFNGDDAVELTKDGAAIDIIGVIGTDPGSAWEVAGTSGATKDHTLTRKSSVCSPNTDWAASAGTDADNSEWIVTAKDSEWDKIGSHQGCGSTPPSDPTLSITFPSDNSTFYTLPGSEAQIELEFNVENFDLTKDGRIVIKELDGAAMQVPTEQDSPIPLHNYGNLITGQHTVTIALQDASNNYLDPAVESTISFTVKDIIDVSDIGTLRKGEVNGQVYRVTGDVLIIYEVKSSSYSNLWSRDNTGAIVVHIVSSSNKIDDSSVGKIYRNVIGSLNLYNGLLQFIPLDNNTDPELVSSDNDITAIDATFTEINSGMYESNLVKVSDVTISDIAGGDGTFVGYKNYEVANTSAEALVLRTSFKDVDYLGEALPTEAFDLIGIIGNYKGTYQITPRSSADIITEPLSNDLFSKDNVSVYPNPAVNNLTFKSSNNEIGSFEIYNTRGQLLINTEGNLSDTTIDISTLDKGVYMLKVSNNNNYQTFKFIK